LYHSNEVGVPPLLAASQVKVSFSPTLMVELDGHPDMVGTPGGSKKKVYLS